MSVILNHIINDLKKMAKPKKALFLQRFFKTGKGEYGEGDVFWGVMVPAQRKVVKKYFKEASLKDVQRLLKSKIHEQRLVGVLVLVAKFSFPICHPRRPRRLGGQSGDPIDLRDPRFREDDNKKQIFNFYLKNTKNINNWDLVDLSAPNIVGQYLLDKDKKILSQLARSHNLWERRIAIIATAAFIRNNQFEETIKIAKVLLKDKHDLIHKAAGWMLRETGKRDQKQLLKFLDLHKKEMPRMMLRYAIEKIPEIKRKYYLNK